MSVAYTYVCLEHTCSELGVFYLMLPLYHITRVTLESKGSTCTLYIYIDRPTEQPQKTTTIIAFFRQQQNIHPPSQAETGAVLQRRWTGLQPDAARSTVQRFVFESGINPREAEGILAALGPTPCHSLFGMRSRTR